MANAHVLTPVTLALTAVAALTFMHGTITVPSPCRACPGGGPLTCPSRVLPVPGREAGPCPSHANDTNASLACELSCSLFVTQHHKAMADIQDNLLCTLLAPAPSYIHPAVKQGRVHTMYYSPISAESSLKNNSTSNKI